MSIDTVLSKDDLLLQTVFFCCRKTQSSLPMNDDTTKAEFEKVNSDGDPVDGALQVIDPEGIVLDEWVTSGPYEIEGKLKAGIEYTLLEKKEGSA